MQVTDVSFNMRGNISVDKPHMNVESDPLLATIAHGRFCCFKVELNQTNKLNVNVNVAVYSLVSP